MAAATAAETSFSAAQRELKAAIRERDFGSHSRNHVPRSSINPMKSKFLSVLLAVVVATLTLSAFAQTGSAAPASSGIPNAPSAPGTNPVPTGPGRVGTINIQEAIVACNEGQRDMGALQKKYEPKQTELKSQNDELESLKKQLDTQGSKLNDDAAAALRKQIESKQKSFDRAVQDAQEEVGNQQQEIAGRILNKMAPLIVKYAQENGYTMIIDTSKPWPQSPVLWWNPDAVDITKNVVDAYNVQSGVAAPPSSTGTAPKPAPRAPAGTTPAAPKPTTPKPSDAPKQ
jgi:Skp family chaperone for outer membrane proteins